MRKGYTKYFRIDFQVNLNWRTLTLFFQWAKFAWLHYKFYLPPLGNSQPSRNACWSTKKKEKFHSIKKQYFYFSRWHGRWSSTVIGTVETSGNKNTATVSSLQENRMYKTNETLDLILEWIFRLLISHVHLISLLSISTRDS